MELLKSVYQYKIIKNIIMNSFEKLMIKCLDDDINIKQFSVKISTKRLSGRIRLCFISDTDLSSKSWKCTF